MSLPGTGKVTIVHGVVNTFMFPVLQFTVKTDHPDYVPGNLVRINQLRYWIRARKPDEPTVGEPVDLAVYRDYTTRKERNLNKKRVNKLALAQAHSLRRAEADMGELYHKLGLPQPQKDETHV